MPGLQITDDYAKRTIDVVQKLLSDIGEIEHCKYSLRYGSDSVNGVRMPVLILEYDYPEGEALGVKPAQAINLLSLATGSPFTDDQLRRKVRNAVEKYLKLLGRPDKAFAIDN